MVSPIKVHARTNVTKSATSFCVGRYTVCLIKLVYSNCGAFVKRLLHDKKQEPLCMGLF